MNLFLIYLLSLFCFINSSLKFNIPNNRDKCFAQEIYSEGTLLIRYDLNGLNAIKSEDQEKVLSNIKIFVKNPRGKIVHELYLNSRKGKFAIYVTINGYYQICSRFYKTWTYSNLPKEVVLGIKLRSDYEYKELQQGLHREDLNEFIQKMLAVRKNVVPSIHVSKLEIEEEDKMAKAIISTSNLYFILSLIQIILIFIIAFYQIFHTRKFLYSKRII